jgi:transcriptional regulator with XRE-family HTH domain
LFFSTKNTKSIEKLKFYCYNNNGVGNLSGLLGDMKGLGARISKLRLDNQLSQEKFGMLIGVTRQTVSRWEMDKRKISAEKIRLICEKFDVDSEYFYAVEFDSKVNKNSENEISKEAVDANVEVLACVSEEQTEECVKEVETVSEQVFIPEKKQNTISKKRLIILLLVTLLSIGIIAIVVGYSINSHKDSFETSAVMSFNLDWASLGWVVFILTGIIVGVISISVVVRISRRCKNNK